MALCWCIGPPIASSASVASRGLREPTARRIGRREAIGAFEIEREIRRPLLPSFRSLTGLASTVAADVNGRCVDSPSTDQVKYLLLLQSRLRDRANSTPECRLSLCFLQH